MEPIHENSSKLRRILEPFENFVKAQTFSGIMLLTLTVIALVWANSAFSHSYADLWHTPVSIGAGEGIFTRSLHFWINDGLMAIFFFVVGLEIKRELLVGELSSPRVAALPAFAAAGGMIMPALIYFLINRGTPAISGWGIPTATDIAFSIGILALMGNRVSVKLKIFLVALAIVDDMGAVILIAVFYTKGVSIYWLWMGVVLFLLLVGLNILKIHKIFLYVILGVLLWIALYNSGIHPTIAGVLTAAAVPARTRINRRNFIEATNHYLNEFQNAHKSGTPIMANNEQQEAVYSIETVCEQVQAPLQRMEHKLHNWVTYLIMPLFALSNAGVTIEGSLTDSLSEGVTLGIILGLVLGKPIGITLFSYVAVKLKIAELPPRENFMKIFGIGCVAGIGFTMSLFIANLAFGESHFLDISKIGVLAASFISGVIGFIYLSIVSRRAG